ncbi:hypothetical protein FQN57_003824 [Myotisia sp. PD_48]|nr:hypothetical protein FQN57_003824 [Myotisia sp. PD_48]
MANIGARLSARQSIETALQTFKELSDKQDYRGFDQRLMNEVRLIDATPTGDSTWELDITEPWGNLNGTRIRIKCSVIQHGRTMALLRGTIESVDGKIVYATAEHHKVAVPTKPDHAEHLQELRVSIGKESKGRL